MRPQCSKSYSRCMCDQCECGCFQLLAVKFFKDMLEYDYGSSWQFLRRLANNKQPLTPPANRFLHLEPVVGSPYECTDPHYDNNIKLIFYVHK